MLIPQAVVQTGAEWASWAPNPTGFTTPSVNRAVYTTIGKLCFFVVDISGTSNATTKSFDLPIAPAAIGEIFLTTTLIQNNGAVATTPGGIRGASASTVNVFRDLSAATAWTASGSANYIAYCFYDTA